jgi:5-methylthioadenosine/S-adenosylhomocysteine deaminase
MYPAHDLVNNLVYSASGSDVVLTMVDGKVLYREGEFLTIDMEKVRFETKRSIDRIVEALK